MFVAYIVEHYFCFLEFKFEFEFSCLNLFQKKAKFFPFFPFSFSILSALLAKSAGGLAWFTRRPLACVPASFSAQHGPRSAHRHPQLAGSRKSGGPP
jgi:hypothetical protein